MVAALVVAAVSDEWEARHEEAERPRPTRITSPAHLCCSWAEAAGEVARPGNARRP